MSRALIVVDVQNDFCEDGSLAVAGGAQVASAIHQHILTSLDDKYYDAIVFSKDWHIGGDHLNLGHFPPAGETPDYVDTWPQHCIQKSPGSDFHPNLRIEELPGITQSFHVFYKGMGEPAYSAFQGRNEVGHSLAVYLSKMAKVDAADVCGIATDYCVKATALDAAAFGLDVRLLMPLTAAVGGILGKAETQAAVEAAGVTVSV